MNTCANPECNQPTKNPKYCSNSCAAKVNGKLYPKRKTRKKCLWCDTIVDNWRDVRCAECQIKYKLTRWDYIQELTLADYWNRDSVKDLHASSKNVHIRMLARSHFRDLLKKPCAKCGYSIHVELCHIKSVASFKSTDKVKDVNSYANLIQLCPNCHWEFDHKMTEQEKATLIHLG